ncbi:hypothetical protein AMECASPLE_023416 [Ameca splendens]|uniref:Spermatogenesis-associated protein 2 PUB-like domain-containing protein n=1 Tax=Ameca splendens TaxID=208324 RepID=A0ABV0XTB2_9TELE
MRGTPVIIPSAPCWEITEACDSVYLISEEGGRPSSSSPGSRNCSRKCSFLFFFFYHQTSEKGPFAEMSALRQRATDLVRCYDQVLEQQIMGRGSCLACKDGKLWMKVEGLLKDLDPREMHCLGLDPLRVMEESLEAAAASASSAAAYSRRSKARPGLQGLAKAFEVLEQAALNLYLGPWRGEYKVIKMYSGTFTHYITPVLSMPQTEKLFGLLGYQPSPSQPEELCLRSPKVEPVSLEDLLRLSCAFLVARCECLLLLSALGKHGGDAQWELSVVRGRQRGHSLQTCINPGWREGQP